MGEEKVGGGGRYDALIPLMGGRDIPASGFALYLDHLMNRVKPVTMAQAASQRILIRAEASQVKLAKEGFDLANRLHQAGYTAEVHLGGQMPAELRWTIDVTEGPQFLLIDQVEHRKFESPTTDEVLKTIRKIVNAS